MKTDLSKQIYSSTAAGHTQWPAEKAYGDDAAQGAFYIGYFNGSVFKARLSFTIPEETIISKSEKLVINLKPLYPEAYSAFRYSRAFLSEQKIENPAPAALSELTDYVESYYYEDINKESRLTSTMTNSTLSEAFLIFEKADFKAGNTYYIYLYPYYYDDMNITDSWTNGDNIYLRWSNATNYLTATLYHESYTKVTPPQIELESNSLERDGSTYFNLTGATDGANNPIVKYRIYYNNEPNLDTNKYVEYLETRALLYNSKLGNLNTGATIYLWAQSVGAVQGFDSDYSAAVNYMVINSAPSAPVFDAAGIIANLRDTDITIENLKATDVNEDSLTYYYKIGSTNDANGSIALKSGDKISLNKNNNFITVWAWDGQVFGEGTVKEIPINPMPEITSISCTGKTYTNLNGQQSIKNLSGSAIVNKQNLSFVWKIRTTSTEYKTLSIDSEFSSLNIQGFGALGEQIYIQLKVTDNVGDTAEYVQQLNYYLLPTLNEGKISVTRAEEGQGEIGSEYFNNSLNFAITLPQSKEGSVNLLACKIFAIDGESKQIDEVKTGLYYGGILERTIDTSSLAYGKNYQFKIEILDTANQSVSSTTATYKKLGLVKTVVGGVYSISPKNQWNIYAQQSFLASCPYQEAPLGEGTYQYALQYSLGSEQWIEIATYKKDDPFVTIAGDSIIFASNDSIKLFRKFNIPTNAFYENIKYRFVIKNAFGAYSDTLSTYTLEGYSIETRQSPTLAGPIYTSYGYRGKESIQYGEKVSEESTDKTRYFHVGEYLSFLLSEKAKDANELIISGEETINREHEEYIYGYKIDYRYEDETEWTDLKTILSSDLSERGQYSAYDMLITSDIFPQINKKVYFRISAIDDTNLISNFIEAESYMIISRKSSPTIIIDSVQYDATSFMVNLNFLDFGGNNKTYQNFIRSAENNEKARIEILYGNTSSSLSSSIIFEDFAIKDLNSSLSLDVIPNSAISLTEKVYFKVNVIFYITPQNNEYNIVKNSTPIFVYYSKGPTVSYRTHWVGINNTDNQQEDVVQISSYGARKKIRLIGEDGTNANEIIIDLANGMVSGISFSGIIIDGGQW